MCCKSINDTAFKCLEMIWMLSEMHSQNMGSPTTLHTVYYINIELLGYLNKVMWQNLFHTSWQVGSRMVIILCEFIMVLMGIIGKIGAIFITIPQPVIGGMLMIIFGVITAAGISYLQVQLTTAGTWIKHFFFFTIEICTKASHFSSPQTWIPLGIYLFLASPCFLHLPFQPGRRTILILSKQVSVLLSKIFSFIFKI